MGIDYTKDPNCKIALRFLEGTGDTLNDSALEHNFTLAGSYSWQTDKPKDHLSGSVYFNGTNAYAQTDITTDLKPTSKISVVAWYKPTLTYPTAMIYSSHNNAVNAHMLGYYIDDTFTNYRTFARIAGGSDSNLKGDVILNNQWYHAAYTYDKDAGANNYKLYTDGLLDKQKTETLTLRTDALYFYLARYFTTHFKGYIAEFGFFDRVLTPTEINDIMDNGIWQQTKENYPTTALKKGKISGYHCFLANYIDATLADYFPLKLPDGTVF